MNEKCELQLHIGNYNDKILRDIMPMDVCHTLLGRPWQFDKSITHDGKNNTYKFQKDGINHTLLSLQEEGTLDYAFDAFNEFRKLIQHLDHFFDYD